MPQIDQQLAKEVLDRSCLPDRATKLPTREPKPDESKSAPAR
jgi:hypothetical protein